MFVESLEEEYNSNLVREKKTGKEAENETDSETFKLILREEWVSDTVKDTLKSLKDFLFYLLKSLKTIKSKTFYEKVCHFLYKLFE